MACNKNKLVFIPNGACENFIPIPNSIPKESDSHRENKSKNRQSAFSEYFLKISQTVISKPTGVKSKTVKSNGTKPKRVKSWNNQCFCRKLTCCCRINWCGIREIQRTASRLYITSLSKRISRIPVPVWLVILFATKLKFAWASSKAINMFENRSLWDCAWVLKKSSGYHDSSLVF